MMNLVRGLLVAAWLLVAWATWLAVDRMGVGVAGDIFLGDLSHPWRRQFNLDFLAHLVLIGVWLGWTAQRRLAGPVVAVLAVLGGGFFSFAYLLARSFGGDGSIRHLLLGRHHRGAGTV